MELIKNYFEFQSKKYNFIIVRKTISESILDKIRYVRYSYEWLILMFNSYDKV